MKKLKLICGLLALCVVLPIWFYLIYSILMAINASELAWFLFWVYMPVVAFTRILSEIAGAESKP